MYDASKIGSFMALRANGWSLAKISKELNISKSTLWEWDNKQQNEIHLLKHLQLEKLQEKYLPTYEEELSKLRGYLDRLESALETQDFSKMGPEYVLQMALQLRARLGKMREQVPLRNVPFNEPLTPLPFTGCVTRQDAHSFRKEYFQGESDQDAAADDLHESSPEVSPPKPTQQAHVGPPAPSESIRESNGVIQVARPSSDSDNNPSIQESNHPLCELRESVVNPEGANRTFPDETPPGVGNGSLKINDFGKPESNGRPVFVSQNGHVNDSDNLHVNGNRHTTAKSNRSGSVNSVSSASSVLNASELRASVVNSAPPNRTFPDETPPGSESGTLKINDFEKSEPNGRPVLNSENGHPNDSEQSASPPAAPSSSVNPVSSESSVLNDSELPDSAVNPSQAGPFVPDGWELSDHVSETGVRLAFPKRKV